MKSVRELVGKKGKVYVLLRDAVSCRKFFEAAEKEGFYFGDGAKPSEKHLSDVIAVSSDMTLSYVGIAGRLAIGSGKAPKVYF